MNETNEYEIQRAFMRGHLSGIMTATIKTSSKLQNIVDVAAAKGADYSIGLLALEIELLEVDIQTIKNALLQTDNTNA